MQASAVHAHHRTVGGTHHRQRGGVAFDEQQSGPLRIGGPPGGLCQRAGGVQLGDHHDIGDILCAQCVAQPRRLAVVGPDDPGGHQPMTVGGDALAGSHDGVEHLTHGILAGPEVHSAGVDRDALAVGALDQHHPDLRGCHRHPEHHLHRASVR